SNRNRSLKLTASPSRRRRNETEKAEFEQKGAVRFRRLPFAFHLALRLPRNEGTLLRRGEARDLAEGLAGAGRGAGRAWPGVKSRAGGHPLQSGEGERGHPQGTRTREEDPPRPHGRAQDFRRPGQGGGREAAPGRYINGRRRQRGYHHILQRNDKCYDQAWGEFEV